MEMKDIFELWDRFDSSDATKMELDFQGMRFKLSRDVSCKNVIVEKADTDLQTAGKLQTENSGQLPVKDGKEINAPLVGVFYRSPAPGEAPYVEVGQNVSKGDVIGIIEAMKMMNEIVAPEDGKVTEILCQDGELVEYNQAILIYH